MSNQEEVTIGAKGTDYGTWKSSPAVRRYINITTVLAALVLFSRIGLKQSALSLVFGVLMIAVGGYSFYLSRVKNVYSYVGGSVIEQNHKKLVGYLKWDGHGTLADVGCGNGPLTVRCAKTFPEAAVKGIDNWGMLWNMTKDRCDGNAEKEGVKERCDFVQSDIVKLPYEDGHFDALISSFAYSEVKRKTDQKPSLQESMRVLKKGAPFALQDFFGRDKMFGKPEELMKWLKRHGVSEIHYVAGDDEIGILWGKK